MRFLQAKKLKAGDMVYHMIKKNADGTPMRAKVTSVKTWKRDLTRIEVRVKHGLYDYAMFDENELHLITTSERVADRKYRVVKQGNSVIVYNNRTGNNRCWDSRNFIYGQGLYDERTNRYPGYVHDAVWND